MKIFAHKNLLSGQKGTRREGKEINFNSEFWVISCKQFVMLLDGFAFDLKIFYPWGSKFKNNQEREKEEHALNMNTAWYWWVFRKHKLASIFFSKYVDFLSRPTRFLLLLFDVTIHFLLTMFLVYQTSLNKHQQSILVVSVSGFVILLWKYMVQNVNKTYIKETLFFSRRQYDHHVFYQRVLLLERRKMFKMFLLLLVPLFAISLLVGLLIWLVFQTESKTYALVTLQSFAKNWVISQAAEFGGLFVLYFLFRHWCPGIQLDDKKQGFDDQKHIQRQAKYRNQIRRGRKEIQEVVTIKRIAWRQKWMAVVHATALEKKQWLQPL